MHSDNAMSIVGIVVPVVTMICFAAVPIFYFYYRHRSRQELQKTLRAAIEQGKGLTPELLEQLGEPARGKDMDLRRGVLAIAFGIGIATFGLLHNDPDVFLKLRAGGALLCTIGIAFIGLWFFSRGRQR
jgi:O-antigen/teichoic acid export membrane protein